MVICLLESIVQIFVTILLMLDSMVRMLLYNVYNILSVFCQLFSVVPLCIIFILTSKLKCLLCNRSNICNAGAQAQCPLLTSFVMLVCLYFLLNAFNALDSVFNFLGYVKDDYNITDPKFSDHHHHVNIRSIKLNTTTFDTTKSFNTTEKLDTTKAFDTTTIFNTTITFDITNATQNRYS